MIVIGLTGGIGMGKSTVAAQFARLGVKVCNADAIVHRLLAKDGAAVTKIGGLFPGVVQDGAVNRKALGEIVFKDKAKLHELEAVLHPMVIAEENAFVGRERRKGARFVVLDIPLLFETGAEERCDMVVVASAPLFIQKQRVMKRPHMTEEKFQRIIHAQMPDSHKRDMADVVIETGLGKAHSARQVALLMKELYAA